MFQKTKFPILILVGIFTLLSLGIVLYYYSLPHFQNPFSFWELLWKQRYPVSVLFLGYLAYRGYLWWLQKKFQAKKFPPWKLGVVTLLLLVWSVVMYASVVGKAYIIFPLLVKSLGMLILPGFLLLVISSAGQKILSLWRLFQNKNPVARIFVGAIVGFSVFLFVLSVLAFFGFYHFWSVLLLLLIILAFSFEYIKKFFTWSFRGNISVVFDSSAHQVVKEVLYVLLVFMVCINFFVVYRPLPIGWDEIAAYMNHSHLLAQTGGMLRGLGMMAWQLFTGIGYLFQGPTQAFFLANLSGLICAWGVYALIQEFLSNKKNTFLPMLGTLAIYMLPMIMYQQTLDLKVDVAVLGFALAAFMVFIWSFSDERENKISVSSCILLGFLCGILFTIKFTAIIFFMALVGTMVISRWGMYGFFAFFLALIGVFELVDIWTIFSIYGKSGPLSILLVLFGIGISIACCYIGQIKKGISFWFIVRKMLLLFAGFLIATSPWLLYNIFTVFSQGGGLSVSTVLYGYGTDAVFSSWSILPTSNPSQLPPVCNFIFNDDYARYFGDECGILGFLRMPWNLSMQIFMKGAIVGVSFLFLVFLMGTLFFQKYRSKYFGALSFVFLLFFAVVFFPHYNSLPVSSIDTELDHEKYFQDYPEDPRFKPGVSVASIQSDAGISVAQKNQLLKLRKDFATPHSFLADVFSQARLPSGYWILFALFLGLCVLFYRGVTYPKESHQALAIFVLIYGFFWLLSSNGVPWYGIVLYPLILCLFFVTWNSSEHLSQGIKSFLSLLSLALVIIYFCLSTFPLIVQNIHSFSSLSYKLGWENGYESYFGKRDSFRSAVIELNLKPEKRTVKDIFPYLHKKHGLPAGVLQAFSEDQTIEDVFYQLARFHETTNDLAAQKEIQETQEYLYTFLLSPPEDFARSVNLYQVGTFIRYYLHTNHLRIYNDQFLFHFLKGVLPAYEEQGKNLFEILETPYVIVDLNLPHLENNFGIHDIVGTQTQFMFFLRERGASVAYSNDICMHIAFGVSELSEDEFIQLATLNHISEAPDGHMYSKEEKQDTCKRLLSEHVSKTPEKFPAAFSDFVDTDEDIPEGDFALFSFEQ